MGGGAQREVELKGKEEAVSQEPLKLGKEVWT